MKPTLYFNGKVVSKLPKKAKLITWEYNKYYGDAAYIEQQNKNASEYFRRMRENREELERRHG